MAKSSSSILQKEKRHISSFLIYLFIVSLSGFVTWIFDGHGTWQQWTYLLHTLLGFILFISFLLFLISHLRITLGFKRPGQAIIGWTSVLAFLLVAISGIVIGVKGQYESQRWLYNLHLISSVIIVLLVLFHLFVFRWLTNHLMKSTVENTRKISSFSYALNKELAIRMTYNTLISTALVVILSVAYQARTVTYKDEAAVPFVADYGDELFLPSLATTSTGTFLDARRVGGSERCGNCHQQITNEWRSSMHARSASDPFFQKNVHSLISKKGMSAVRYCGGCHIPIALLSGEISTGGQMKTGMHIKEGVSCMGCHGIRQTTSLKGVGSYLFEPEEHYLFGDSEGNIQTEIHDYLIKINPRQHRKDMAREVLSNPTSCATCHEQYIDKDLNNWGWVQLQSQYQTWLNGPFSTHSDKNYASEKAYRCQDCHFPLVDSTDPSADNMGKHASHRSPAANTAVPFLLGDQEQLDTVIRFLQDNRITMTLHHKNKIEVNDSTKQAKVTIQVVIASNKIGHFFPAGTVDINEPWIELIVTDANNKQVYASGLIDEHNRVDKDAHFYLSQLVNRDGKHVWKHDLFNAIGESYVNLLLPGKADIQTYQFPLAKGVKSPLTVKTRLRYRKFNHDYSSWALEDSSLKFPIVDMAKDELSISLSNSSK